MKRKTIAPIAAALLAGVLNPAWGGAAPQVSDAAGHMATIEQYCVGCHNDVALTGGVSFEGLDADSIGEHAETFEMAVRKMRGGVMPPPGVRQPEAEAIDSLVAWLEDSLDAAEGLEHLPDQVVLHRLNRREYGNAIRDLLATEIDVEEFLPEDDTAEGFDNIATALQVSPSVIEQ